MKKEIEDVLAEDLQTDPDFKTVRCYVRITARAVHERLLKKPPCTAEVFCRRTLHNVLDRLGYTLKKVLKTKPLRKVPETDAIFANVALRHEEAKANPAILRLSIDTKAKVKIGNLSRGGYCRALHTLSAEDHDQHWDATLVPLGIYEVNTEQVSIFFGNSLQTSDFITEGLEQWWLLRKDKLGHHEQIMIDLDNGQSSAGNTRRFVRQMVAFAKTINMPVQLVYYPPYHSKYNKVERVWAVLENYWRGLILDTVDNTLKIAGQMTWKGVQPIVRLIDKVYQKGLPVPSKRELKELHRFIRRHDTLKKWDIHFSPVPV